MKKKIISIILTVSAICAVCMPIHASTETALYANGVRAEENINILEIDGNVFVPIRPIWNTAGYKLVWDNMRKRIVTTTAIGKLTIQIGSNLVSVNPNKYEPKLISAYPRIYEGQTMIPIDFAAECVGASIQYSKANNAVMIISE